MSSAQESKEKKHGFIHNVSPVKTSKRTQHQWYDFQLQTAPNKIRRVVSFNPSFHTHMQHYEQSKTPVLLKNIIVKENEGDWLFNQQSTAYPCSNSDVPFECKVPPKPEPTAQQLPATEVTIKQLSTITTNQKINVSGTLSFGDKEPKQVMIKATQTASHVKEDCILEDSTGTVTLHIWDPLIHQLKTGKSYVFTNLTVKYYQGSTFLSTSPLTTAIETTVSLEKVMGPELLRTPEQEITVPDFKFISRLTLFSPCTVCNKRLTDLSSSSTKCQQCGTRQRTTHLTRESSVRICVVHNNTDPWLSAFTKEITKLLEAKSLTLNNTVEDIEEAMMNLQNITFKYDGQKNVITDIVSVKDHP
ncbi:uncharacterized protein [Montipora foliosa]|uniref:uncharacterized protein n=1 Tax=Montipora foliosa TaxID=591990 RepID=UPI0035F1EBC3